MADRKCVTLQSLIVGDIAGMMPVTSNQFRKIIKGAKCHIFLMRNNKTLQKNAHYRIRKE